MTKAKEPNVNNGLDTSQKKALILGEYIVTSVNIVGCGHRVNSDPDKINGFTNLQ
jgi:hypothetical protein